MRSRRWLTLGIGVKRYILLIFAGTVILALALAMFLAYVYRTIDVPGPAGSVVYFMTLQFIEHPFRSLVVGGLGLTGVVAGAFLLGRTVLSVVVSPDDNIAETLYQSRRLQRGPRIVAIGGRHRPGRAAAGAQGAHQHHHRRGDGGGRRRQLGAAAGRVWPGPARRRAPVPGGAGRFRIADERGDELSLQSRRRAPGTQLGQSADRRDHRAQGRQFRAGRARAERRAAGARAHPAVHPLGHPAGR